MQSKSSWRNDLENGWNSGQREGRSRALEFSKAKEGGARIEIPIID
jgi:hypothetical protein